MDTVPPQLDGLQAEVKKGKLTVSYQPSKAQIDDILSRVHAAGLTIQDISTEEVELEDLFIKLTSAA